MEHRAGPKRVSGDRNKKADLALVGLEYTMWRPGSPGSLGPVGAGRSDGPFVGRWAEMRVLRGLAATSLSGGTACGVVLGTPGLGKSRLLGEVAKALDQRCVLIQGYQTTHQIALAAAAGLLRELARAPQVGARLDALMVGGSAMAIAPESVRLFEIAFRCVLHMCPLGIIADDLQWMDSETLALLHYLIVASSGAGAPLFVLCAGRPAPEPALFAAQLAEALPSERFTRIELGPLEEQDGIALLAARAPGLGSDRAIQLWRRASGSPFWMTALADDLTSGDNPDRSPQHLIRDRCATLDMDPAALLALLLVGAQPLSMDAVGELMDWREDRVRSAALDLADRALAVENGTMLSIAHDLIRETAFRELGEDERLRMHRHLALWLENSAGEDVRQLSRALEHRTAAGLDSQALALRIARSPQRRLIGARGVAMLAEIADSVGGTRAQALQVEVAALAYEIGDWATALERWSVLADRVVPGPERATAALSAAAAALRLGRPFEVHAFAAKARALAGQDAVPAIEADCMDAQSLLWLEGRVAEAEPLVAGAMAASERLIGRPGGVGALSDREASAYVMALRADLDAAIRRADAETVRHCAELIQRAARDPAEVLAAASDGVFSMLQFEGLPRSAEPKAKRALEESRRLTLPTLEVEATHWVGWVAHHLGRLDEASAMMNQAITLAERVGTPRRFTLPQLRAVLHGIEASRTDWQSNVEALRRLIATERDPHFRLVIRTIHMGLVGRFSTPAAGALEALIDAMGADADLAGCGRCLWESVLHSAEASARIGSTATAEQALERWDTSHANPSPGGPAARRAYVEALITARRDPEASIALFDQAAHAAEEVGYRLMRLWIEFDAASTLAYIDRPKAVQDLQRVTREAEEMGAASEAKLAMARLRSLGVNTWRRGPSGSGTALSSRELEIAEAVARGATNPEIAESLFLSRKTVERHVSHILAKLGARNRAELAARLVHKDEGTAG